MCRRKAKTRCFARCEPVAGPFLLSFHLLPPPVAMGGSSAVAPTATRLTIASEQSPCGASTSSPSACRLCSSARPSTETLMPSVERCMPPRRRRREASSSSLPRPRSARRCCRRDSRMRSPSSEDSPRAGSVWTKFALGNSWSRPSWSSTATQQHCVAAERCCSVAHANISAARRLGPESDGVQPTIAGMP